MNLSEHFRVEEFVTPTIFNAYGEASKWYIDVTVVAFMEEIRERFGKPVNVNDWYRDGHLQERGHRLPDTTTGAWYSQHKFGRACDFHIDGITPDQIFNDVLQNQQLYLDFGVTTIEDVAMTPTWIHLDCRWTGLETIKVVQP